MKTDTDLLLDFKRGDPAGLKGLFRRHHMGLLNFFHALGPCFSDQSAPRNANAVAGLNAEDLTEQVFLRLFADRERIKVQPPFKFSLILYRLAYAFWLVSSRHRHSLAPELYKLDECEGMAGMLQPLPDELKAILVLYEINGLSYAEIARVTELPEVEIQRRMHAAYGYLRAQLPAQTHGD